MRVPLRIQKLLLSVATVVCMAASVVVGIWGAQAPDVPSFSAKEAAENSSPPLSEVEEQGTGPAKGDFAQLCELPLRRPLYDPPPPAPEVRQLPPLRVELLGTILEGENSMAILRSDEGQVEYRRQGDSVGPVDCPAKLVEIQGDAVVLDRENERVTLRVQGSERR